MATRNTVSRIYTNLFEQPPEIPSAPPTRFDPFPVDWSRVNPDRMGLSSELSYIGSDPRRQPVAQPIPVAPRVPRFDPFPVDWGRVNPDRQGLSSELRYFEADKRPPQDDRPMELIEFGQASGQRISPPAIPSAPVPVPQYDPYPIDLTRFREGTPSRFENDPRQPAMQPPVPVAATVAAPVAPPVAQKPVMAAAVSPPVAPNMIQHDVANSPVSPPDRMQRQPVNRTAPGREESGRKFDPFLSDGSNDAAMANASPEDRTTGAMAALLPQKYRPGTTAFAGRGGGVFVLQNANVRGGNAYTPSSKGYIGVGGPQPGSDYNIAPVSAPAAPTPWWEARGPQMVPKAPPVAPAYSAIAEAEAINRENSMRRRGIETAMTPGGIRSGPTNVWERNVAGAMRQQDAQAAAKVEADRAAVVRATNTQEKRAEQERELQNRIRVAEISNPPTTPKVDNDPVDPETGLKLSESTKGYFKALEGNKQDPFYKLRLDGAKQRQDAEEIAKIEAEYGPQEQVIERWRNVLKRMGRDPDKDLTPPPKKPVNPAPATTATAAPSPGAPKKVRTY